MTWKASRFHVSLCKTRTLKKTRKPSFGTKATENKLETSSVSRPEQRWAYENAPVN